MPKTLGFSLYLSTFDQQWPTLKVWAGTEAPIFLSLHISEEFDSTYCQRARAICHSLAAFGFRTIADVSVKTLQQFGCDNLPELAKELKLWGLRIDYGFSAEEIGEMARTMPIVLNASTTDPEDARRIAENGREVFALHNFYPRPETGLDEEYLMETTQKLRAAGLSVQCFIPGDTLLRGPLHEGLPTLEAHRHVLPSAAFVDLALRFSMDEIFLADPGLSEKEQQRPGPAGRKLAASLRQGLHLPGRFPQVAHPVPGIPGLFLPGRKRGAAQLRPAPPGRHHRG